jgi:hypothetical protein
MSICGIQQRPTGRAGAATPRAAVDQIQFRTGRPTVATLRQTSPPFELWDAGRPAAHPARGLGTLARARFSPDGRVIVWEHPDRESHLLPACPQGDRRLVLWVQVLSGMEMAADGTLTVLEGSLLRERQEQLRQLGGPPTP